METEADTERAMPGVIPKEGRLGKTLWRATQSYVLSLLFPSGTFPLLICHSIAIYLCWPQFLAQGYGDGNTWPPLLGAQPHTLLSQPLPRTEDAPDHPGSGQQQVLRPPGSSPKDLRWGTGLHPDDCFQPLRNGPGK